MESNLRRIHKNTIRKLTLQTEKNRNGIDLLRKKRIIAPQSHSFKKYQKIILLDHVSYQVAGNEGFHLVQEFYKMPAWAIPNIYVVVQGDPEDGTSIEGFTDFADNSKLFDSSYTYHWQQVTSEDPDIVDHYNLYIDVYATLRERVESQYGYSYQQIPLYLNVYIIYINEQTSYEIQKQKA